MIWIFAFVVLIGVIASYRHYCYVQLEKEVLADLGISGWRVFDGPDDRIDVKSRQTLERYDDVKYFKDDRTRLFNAKQVMDEKNELNERLEHFLASNPFKSRSQYRRIENEVRRLQQKTAAYFVYVSYVSPAGRSSDGFTLAMMPDRVEEFVCDPSLTMGKGAYNQYRREKQKQALDTQQDEFYQRVRKLLETINQQRQFLVIKGSEAELERLYNQLYDRTVNSIKKVRSADSQEWEVIDDFLSQTERAVAQILRSNQKILDYYQSPAFAQIQQTCSGLMASQREFNSYINEKVQSISSLFGTRVVRNETVHDDSNDYLRPYQKTITPFTAEVSATVFASAENNPLDYVVKNFYPDKQRYPEQIRKLYQLVEEFETLRDAKQIIENYKADYQQYLKAVPDYVMKYDEAGFYSRLGFANIDESVLTVAYQFVYTSGGGKAQRSFTVPMTEETIGELIRLLESKLTAAARAKEQRTLMTKKLREAIKKRDNYTCCNCGNSTFKEPNLLLEIDHIMPVAKGGLTEESNLQTLCWKCNRAKSDKYAGATATAGTATGTSTTSTAKAATTAAKTSPFTATAKTSPFTATAKTSPFTAAAKTSPFTATAKPTSASTSPTKKAGTADRATAAKQNSQQNKSFNFSFNMKKPAGPKA